MFTVEQHFNDLNQSNNNNNNGGQNVSTESSPDMQYEGRLALREETMHMGEGLDLPVFTERSIITMQPGESDHTPATMPFNTEGRQATTNNHFVPLCGLDFLQGAEKLIIQRTMEINDLFATIESENRYIIKVPQAETLFQASETSSDCQRACCGSSRGFEMKIYDRNRQLALVLKRDLACNVCWFGCCLQELNLFADRGQHLGKILQQWTLLIPSFFVIDGIGNIRYRIEGPMYLLCNMQKGSEFKILSRDGLVQEGSIKHVWDADLCHYNMLIDFPQGTITAEIKSLILGAGFLLEYMYFQTNETRSCRCCSN